MASEAKPKIILHWLEKSRAQRILWLLEELELEYELKTYKRGIDFLAPAELKKAHPLGKSPVVEVIYSEGSVVLAESGAIIEYLTEKVGPHLIPQRYPDGKDSGPETEEFIRWRYFLHYGEGSLMILVLMRLFMNQISRPPIPFFMRPVTKAVATAVEIGFLNKNFKTHLNFIEEQLKTSPGGGKYLCGQKLTGADILMIFPLEAIMGKGLDARKYPTIGGYVNMLHLSPGYKKALKKCLETTGKAYTTEYKD